MRAVPPWIPPVLLLVCIALYGPGLGGAFMFDSTQVLANNAQLHLEPGEFIAWRNAVFSTETGPSGRPVSMFTFAVNHALSGTASPFGIKLVNLLIHCVTALLAWQFLRLALVSSVALPVSRRRAEWVALSAAALWLLHPLQVSSVLYSVQRMEQLSALFTVLGLLAWLHYRPRWLSRAATATELSHCALAIGLCTALAALSKEDGVLLLPLLLLVEVIFFRARYNGGELRGAVVVAGGLLYLPLLLIALLVWVQPDWLLAGYRGRDFDLVERLLTQSRILWQYLVWIVVPDIRPLGLHHDTVTISTGLFSPKTTALALAAWAGLLLAGVVAWRRWPVLYFALGWFLFAHLLESSVVPLELMYEHRNYLASLAPCLLLSWAIWCGLPRLKRRQRAALVGVLLIVLALQLASRASLWGDEEQLAAYHLYHHPDSPRSVYHYANVQLRRGEAASDPAEMGRRLALARQYYEGILQLDPTDMSALATLLYLDDRYFSSLQSERWITELSALAQRHAMRRNDKAALGLLLECLASGWCKMPVSAFQQMLLTLADRYPQEPVYLDLLARYAGEVEEDYPLAIHYHLQLLEAHPHYREASAGLVAWHSRGGDRDGMLTYLGEFLARHPDPVSVQRIKTMLETAGEQ